MVIDEILNKETELCHIMKKWGSDKSTWHNYTRLYFHLFDKLKEKGANIFELGLGTTNSNISSHMGPFGKPGASLRAWKEFFVDANIFGADIDNTILFTELQIETFYCDQTSPLKISEMWNNENLKEINFDVIIDDGLHEFSANLCFFENSIQKLKQGGFYIIEDLTPLSVRKFNEILTELKDKYPYLEIELVKLNWNGNQGGDNNLLVIKSRL
jgi:SAM-dependent methyltransferase